MTARAHDDQREARRLALGAVFEADFGQATSSRIIDRRVQEEGTTQEAALLARRIVDAVARHRETIDARIGSAAPAYPVTQLARIDRALLRSGMGELLHCPTTPARVAISEWVELARTYSGDPARRLVNGVLGRVAREDTGGRAQARRSGANQTDKNAQSESNDSGGRGE